MAIIERMKEKQTLEQSYTALLLDMEKAQYLLLSIKNNLKGIEDYAGYQDIASDEEKTNIEKAKTSIAALEQALASIPDMPKEETTDSNNSPAV